MNNTFRKLVAYELERALKERERPPWITPQSWREILLRKRLSPALEQQLAEAYRDVLRRELEAETPTAEAARALEQLLLKELALTHQALQTAQERLQALEDAAAEFARALVHRLGLSAADALGLRLGELARRLGLSAGESRYVEGVGIGLTEHVVLLVSGEVHRFPEEATLREALQAIAKEIADEIARLEPVASRLEARRALLRDRLAELAAGKSKERVSENLFASPDAIMRYVEERARKAYRNGRLPWGFWKHTYEELLQVWERSGFDRQHFPFASPESLKVAFHRWKS